MSKSTRKAGTQWSPSDVAKLRALAKENNPTRVMALKLERTPAGVQSKASEKGIPLKPWNQRPYGTKRQ